MAEKNKHEPYLFFGAMALVIVSAIVVEQNYPGLMKLFYYMYAAIAAIMIMPLIWMIGAAGGSIIEKKSKGK